MLKLASPGTRMTTSWPVSAPDSYRGHVTSTITTTPGDGQRTAPAGRRYPVWRGALTLTAHAVTGMPVGIVSFVVALTLAALTAGLMITFVLAVPVLVALLLSIRALTHVQRSRFRSLLGVDIPPPTRPVGETWGARLKAETRSGDTWRQFGYHLLALPLGVLGFVLVTTVWAWALALVTLPAYAWTLPANGLFGWELHSPAMVAALTVTGILLLLVAPWVAWAVASVDTAVAVALLGPSRSKALARRVEDLTRSRAGAVDAADAERRRIERDLHDGAQQRLVSLAMNLGRARTRLRDAPEPARKAIEEAHEEAKQALAELRDFVRGLHPAVLDDRGLDAALSGIVARAPLPVRLRVDVPGRCSPTIEAIAYFVVAEALTNVIKHARATTAEVNVTATDGRLRIAVTDDGHGGASPDAGSGLRGLAQRTAAADGVLRIDSPPGGPTVIEVDLPCES